MPIPAVDSQMLSTLELLHYCRRFQDTLFALCFEQSAHCEKVLMDLRVLHAARIRLVIFCAADAGLTRTLRRWNRAGDRFTVTDASPEDLRSAAFIGQLQSDINAGKAPLVALKRLPRNSDGHTQIEADMLHCAVALGARKVFFPGPASGLEINGRFRSYPTLQEVRDALTSGLAFNIPRERVEFIIAQQALLRVDIVLVEARRGAIFEEVFTHSGSGTLFTQEYPNILRAATESDVRDIMAIMQPSIDDGSLKAVSEEDLLQMIRSFMVYSVNGQIVAAAALIEYGDAYELGKLCTLPRYQARGRARALVRSLLEKARTDGKDRVFALTVHEYVGEFFEKLGFTAVPRETLPESWRKEYDFSRPSKAYEYRLTKE